MPTNSRAANLRAGTDLNQDDIDGLALAVSTKEGRKAFQTYMKLASRETDSIRQDALAHYARNFWRDENWRSDANEMSAALSKNKASISTDLTIDTDEGSVNFSAEDLNGLATDNYVNADDVRTQNRARRGQASAQRTAGHSVGYLGTEKGNKDQEINIERDEFFSKLLAAMGKVNRKQGKPAFMIILGSQGIDLSTYTRLNKEDSILWAEVYEAGESTNWKNLNNIGKIFGIPTMAMSTWSKKLMEGIKRVFSKRELTGVNFKELSDNQLKSLLKQLLIPREKNNHDRDSASAGMANRDDQDGSEVSIVLENNDVEIKEGAKDILDLVSDIQIAGRMAINNADSENLQDAIDAYDTLRTELRHGNVDFSGMAPDLNTAIKVLDNLQSILRAKVK